MVVGLALGSLCASGAMAQTLSCSSRPDLCNRPVSSEINSSLSTAQDIVFLGDGYTANELNQFATAISNLIQGLKNLPQGQGFVDLDPSLFNFHRIDVASATSDLADADLTDTAFGARGVSGAAIPYDTNALLFAAAQNAPDVDTVILLINSPVGRAYAARPTSHISGGRTVITTQPGNLNTLTHELGHAIFRLGDEYSEYTGCYSGGEYGWVTIPNLTSDALGQKFARAYADPSAQPPPIEGGGLYPQCVYRPAPQCRMRNGDSWCPVCGRMVQTLLEEKRYGDDRDAPYSALGGMSPTGKAAGVMELLVGKFDSRGVVLNELWVDEIARPIDSIGRFLWDTRTEPTGTHTLRTQATDGSGKTDPNVLSYEVTVFRDAEAPTLTVLEPSNNATLSGVFQMHASASDNFQLAGWEVRIDGQFASAGGWYGSGSTNSEIFTNITSDDFEDGPHTVTMTLKDNSENQVVSTLHLTFGNTAADTVAPVVNLDQPPSGAVLSGNVTVLATAQDNVGVSQVEVLIDGTVVASRSASPYTFTWDTTSWPDGNHTIQARAQDAAGNTALSGSRNVVVSNGTTAGWPVLFVVGAKQLDAAEQAIKNRLSTNLGANVTVIIGSKASKRSANGADLVLISPSAKEGAVGKKFRKATAPVLCLNARLFDELALTRPKWGSQEGTSPGQTGLNIVSPSHPLAAGFSGNLNSVTSSPADYSWGVPANGATVAASLSGATDKAASFGYESGTAMVGSQIAPARRTGLFATADAIAKFTASAKGWALFDAAVQWTAGR
ncbi:MAG: hypothetical protein H6714_08500 [Myxococcales bacterium]|nr:hypothetical protein [Myxococcales bacterium]